MKQKHILLILAGAFIVACGLTACGKNGPKQTGIAVIDSAAADLVAIQGDSIADTVMAPVIDTAAMNKQRAEKSDSFLRVIFVKDAEGKPVREPKVVKTGVGNFQIARHEVTQELWEAVMGSNPSYTKGAKLPVERVSLEDCYSFIEKLNAMTGRHFRLPNYQEWLYAALGGDLRTQTLYAGSDNPDSVALTQENSDFHSHEVGTKAPNAFGLYDMSGNVYELCTTPMPKPRKEKPLTLRQRLSKLKHSIRHREEKKKEEVPLRCYIMGGSWGSNLEDCLLRPKEGPMTAQRDQSHVIYGLRLAHD